MGVVGDGLGGELTRQNGGVDFDRGHLRPPVEQCQRQRTETRAHFEHHVIAIHPRRRHDPTHGVGVVDEVLSKRLPGGPELEFLCQMPYLGPPE